MNMRKSLLALSVGAVMAMGAGSAMAVPAVDCGTIGTVRDWQAAGTCNQSDKDWTFISASDNLLAAQTIFGVVSLIHTMQIVGFDDSDDAGAWNINYRIDVVSANPDRGIVEMYAGADNPGGGSRLDKDVTGDDTFSLAVVDGAEDAGSENTNIPYARSLTVDESFSVDAGSVLLSVSNTFVQEDKPSPEPGTLALAGLALAGIGMAAKRRKSS